jgi:dipicolinate synthase subunit B
MLLKGIRVGFVLTGSHCTFAKVIPQIEKIISEGAEVFPVVSYAVSSTDTRFGSSKEWCDKLQDLTKKPLITTIVEAEPVGPGKLFDILVVAPCTGNTLAKLANGITDTPALMAIKAHMRNQRSVVIAISTNDGLGFNAKNIAAFPGMGASIRTAGAARLRAISSASLIILLTLTPGAGWIS